MVGLNGIQSCLVNILIFSLLQFQQEYTHKLSNSFKIQIGHPFTSKFFFSDPTCVESLRENNFESYKNLRQKMFPFEF